MHQGNRERVDEDCMCYDLAAGWTSNMTRRVKEVREMIGIRGIALVAFVVGGCSEGSRQDEDGLNDNDDTMVEAEPRGCRNWDNWSCWTETHYCFATCEEGGTWWMKCYPGTSYPCYYGAAETTGSCDTPESGSADECDACEEALQDCIVPAVD